MRGKVVRMFLLVGGVVAAASLVSIALEAQPPRTQGGPPGGFRGPQAGMARMMVERAVHGSWGFVSLELGVSDEKLIELRAVYQETWEASRASLNELESADQDARRGLMQAVMESQRELRETVKGHLSEEQGIELDEWYKAQRAQMSGRGGGRGGPDARGGGGDAPRGYRPRD